MSALLFQIITIATDLVIIIFVLYYFLKLRVRERDLKMRENKIDTNYHEVVDNALTKERKILEDATGEAQHIITDAKLMSDTSKQTIDHALQQLVNDMQKDSLTTAREFSTSYQEALKRIGVQSLTDFHNVTKELALDLQKQTKEFHEKFLPEMEKELETYKQVRFQQTEQTITHVVQKVSQEVLNKSLSLTDHQDLVIRSLERAKKEGMFG